MIDDFEEFLEIVGTETTPIYHFYVTEGVVEQIRINQIPGSSCWPLVWHKDAVNELGSPEVIDKINHEVREKRARAIGHLTRDYDRRVL